VTPLAAERQDDRRYGSIVKPKTIALIGAVILVALTFVVQVVPHPVWSYRGPGTMRDHGVLGYPRYELKLPSMSVDDKYRSFSFTGVPSEDMSLQLYVVGATIETLAPLEKWRTQITAQLFEEATPLVPRRVLCSATGSPSEGQKDGRWVVTGSYIHAAFWHAECLRVPMSKERRYTLTLEIAGADSSSRARVLVPTLRGGGIELP
jgi:hypothetical protein